MLYALQPAFHTTCAMSLAVFTVSTIFPMKPGGCGSSSLSSNGINIPDGVRRSPLGSPRREYGSEAVGVFGRFDHVGLKYPSPSSSSSARRKFLDGLDGLSVSDDGDGDSLLDLYRRECDVVCSGTSGESVLYFSVVDGSLATILLSVVLMLVFELVRDSGFRRRARFIITTPSSDEDSSSFAQGLRLKSSSSSSPSLHSSAMHCSTLSSKRMCLFSSLGVWSPDVDLDEK